MTWWNRRKRMERSLRNNMLEMARLGARLTGNESEVGVLNAEQETQIQQYFEILDSRSVEQAAERWGIDIPIRPEWFSTRIYKNDYADVVGGPEMYTDKWLNATGRTMISKQVREARFAYWKGWVDLLIPILALLVAALALFKDIIVEVLRK